MKADAFQKKINQLSLVMTIPEDIIKACKKAELPSQITEILIRFHNQQTEMEKSLNALRNIQLQMAQVLDANANFAMSFKSAIENISKHVGFTGDEHVTSEEVGIKD